MPPRVLDVGSGSGILGHRRPGAGRRSVDALDTDPVAVDGRGSQCGRNGVADRLPAAGARWTMPCREPYPLVLANLVAAVLIELAPRLAAHTAAGGTLLASGIIADARR